MALINLFGLGQRGKSPVVTAQRHMNLYAEITQEAEKSNVVFYGTPGLLLFTSFGDTPVRGAIVVGDYLYAVHRGTFWQVDNAGAKTSRGTLTTTSGRVDLAHNGTQIVVADGTSMYCYTIATTAFATVSSSLLANPVTVTFQDGYFLASFANSGQFQKSASYDGTSWNALDFATAESNPDYLIRIFADHGEVVLPGADTTEFWGNTGAADFPYENQRGTTQEFGLAARWSLVKYNDSLAGVFKNKMGQVQVMRLAGHSFVPLSTPEHSALINAYSTVSDATAFSYMLGGHPMLQVNFPTAGKSWLFDALTGMWTHLESGLNGDRHRGEILVDYLNKPRVTDYANGNIYTLDASTYTDNGTAIKRQIVGRHIFHGKNRTHLSYLQIGFETGVGITTGQGSDPQVVLRVSKDNGRTWGPERWRPLGKIGEYLTRVTWNRLGAAFDWLFEITITDPVKVVITNAFAGADDE